MDKKYQIFISSTYVDLKEQRDQVVKTVLRMGHLPVGMEMFNAADQAQWEVIKRHIDNSDYYIVVLAHRYGSLDTDDIGFTEKEYNYATEKGIPCLAFVIDDKASWSPEYVDDGELKEKLKAFKTKVKNRLVNQWSTIDNLSYHILSSLTEAFTINPRVGWVRANETTTSPLVAEEISRLSKENNELKQLVAANSAANDPIQQAYNILDSVTYEFNFSDTAYNGTFLELFHKSRKFITESTNVSYLYMQLYSNMTGNESYQINQQNNETIAKNNKNIYESFIDRITILRLVEQIINNNSSSPPLKITDKGWELILKIEHPD